jgi:two-component system response regulator (stage 0 sporulation protein F)
MSANNLIVSIVDDDLDISLLFRDALKNIAEITIIFFTDPFSVLEHFKMMRHAYALVISDSKMPGLNGMELLRKIKGMNPFVRTILITAFAIDQDLFMRYAEQKIINGFLRKPIRLDELRDEVKIQLLAYKLELKKGSKVS